MNNTPNILSMVTGINTFLSFSPRIATARIATHTGLVSVIADTSDTGRWVNE